MALKLISLLILSIWISGCTTTQTVNGNTLDENKVRTFAAIYRRSKESAQSIERPVSKLALNVPVGYVKPYLPVILPPRVIKVWVPAHVVNADRTVLVAGHWSFVMLEGTHWFIEGEGRVWQ